MPFTNVYRLLAFFFFCLMPMYGPFPLNWVPNPIIFQCPVIIDNLILTSKRPILQLAVSIALLHTNN